MERRVTVEGICLDAEGRVELYLSDETTLLVMAELMQKALASQENPFPDIDQATSKGPVSLKVTSKGSDILDIVRVE